jgi:hypothetical protein
VFLAITHLLARSLALFHLKRVSRRVNVKRATNISSSASGVLALSRARASTFSLSVFMTVTQALKMFSRFSLFLFLFLTLWLALAKS